MAVKDKVTEDDIKESMKNILEEMPTVGDVTMDANTLTVLGEYQSSALLVNWISNVITQELRFIAFMAKKWSFFSETTEACLTECLGCKDPAKCGDNPPPIPFDACCGGCPAGIFSQNNPKLPEMTPNNPNDPKWLK